MQKVLLLLFSWFAAGKSFGPYGKDGQGGGRKNLAFGRLGVAISHINPSMLVDGEAGPYQHLFTVKGSWKEVGSNFLEKKNLLQC